MSDKNQQPTCTEINAADSLWVSSSQLPSCDNTIDVKMFGNKENYTILQVLGEINIKSEHTNVFCGSEIAQKTSLSIML